ncbi:hypothetical protein GCM10027568_24740 [Humibacter soli]
MPLSRVASGSLLRQRLIAASDSRVALWCAFGVVHVALAVLVFTADGTRLGDVLSHYLPWAERAVHGHGVVGIHSAWVYPIAAIVPVVVPMLFGAHAYGAMWVLMITVADAVVVYLLSYRRLRPRMVAAWWWLAFLLLLGPISIVRLDAVSAVIAIVAVLWLASRPRVAVVLLTIATWMKVWPAALLLPVLVMVRGRWRTIVAMVATTVAIVAVPLLVGAGANVLSFVGMQDSRGLQVEAPIATWWIWSAALGRHGFYVEYMRALNTYQAAGPGSALVGDVMTLLLGVAIIAIALLGIRATRRGDADALPALMLACVTALIVFNKVGSPQYITWLAAPVVYGIVQNRREFRMPALLVLAAAVLTQSFYPYLYHFVITAAPPVLALVALRNAALCWLLAWAVVRLWRGAPVDVAPLPTPEPHRATSLVE